MAFKFPFTNYHELNLTWVLDQLKSLFEKSEENVTVIENYNGRLTAVETELPLVAETAQGAAQQAAGAATLAQQAKSTADTAQGNAIQAQGLAGTARQEAQQAQAAADAATQAAQQAQATAQNFDGRITQAENDASQALEASRSFENRVQSAITTANNAAQTATNAQGIATRADQNAALALDTLKAQRSELERIGREQAALISEETESGKTEIQTLAQSVLDSIPSDYTALSNLVDKKAPVIINSASGAVASFNDGADNMKIQKLLVNIEPLQAGSGDPSPDNVRPISGWKGAEIKQAGKNLVDISNQISVTFPTTIYGGEDEVISGKLKSTMGIVDLGTFNWTYASSGGRSLFTSYDLANRYKQSGGSSIPVNAMFECYSNVAMNSTFKNGDAGLDGNISSRIVVCDNRYTDADSFKAAMSGIHLCYELKEPVEYTLTPQEMKTLYGANNIWANAGPVSVDYPADTKLYIDGKLAEIQETILENI